MFLFQPFEIQSPCFGFGASKMSCGFFYPRLIPMQETKGGKSNEILQKIPAKGLLGELVGVTEIQDGGGRVVWSDGWGRRFSCYFLDLLGYQCGIHQKINGEK